MCGILCVIQNESCTCNLDDLRQKIERDLKNRGPDVQNSVTIEDNSSFRIYFHATLLWLRGAQPFIQPVQRDGNVLLWNGDLYDTELPDGISDTELLTQQLSCGETHFDIRKVLSQIKGPGSYIFYNERLKTLWFGRDVLGRHSLLATIEKCHTIIASIGFSGSNLVEVPSNGIYEIALDRNLFKLYPWSHKAPKSPFMPFEIQTEDVPASIEKVAVEPAGEIFCDVDEFLRSPVGENAIEGLRKVLMLAVEERVGAQPLLCKECIWNEVSKTGGAFTSTAIKLSAGVCHQSKVAVLFSGGIDSVVLAYLAGQCLKPGEPLDLINVAFEQADGSFDVPDRITAHQAYEELKTLLPDRLFNLVLVNVTKSQLREMREARIKNLLYPLETVLDDSIGCAIWFAARGQGQLWNRDNIDYCSPARVILLGMGADEQLGGYSKHKSAFMHEGREGLLRELQRQMDSISERNLGRDNRIVSDHGVAGRYPFLDERVINFLAGLPLESKMNLSLERGIGDKMVLRGLAISFGLKKTAREPKRAIQFGSRIAKMENRKEKASDKAVRT